MNFPLLEHETLGCLRLSKGWARNRPTWVCKMIERGYRDPRYAVQINVDSCEENGGRKGPLAELAFGAGDQLVMLIPCIYQLQLKSILLLFWLFLIDSLVTVGLKTRVVRMYGFTRRTPTSCVMLTTLQVGKKYVELRFDPYHQCLH